MQIKSAPAGSGTDFPNKTPPDFQCTDTLLYTFYKKTAASPFYSGKAAAACLYRFKLEPDAAHQEIFLRGRFRFFQLSASKP